MDDGGDNLFESGDAIYFYAEALDRYEYDTGRPAYLKNNYTEMNYYWLAVGGSSGITPLRWQSIDGTPGQTPDQVVTVVRQVVRAEQDITLDDDNYIWDYFNWYWPNESVINISANLPILSQGDSINVAMRAVGRYNQTEISLNGTLMTRYYNDGYKFYDYSGAGVPGLNTFQVTPIPGGAGTHLDYLDISYPMVLNYYPLCATY